MNEQKSKEVKDIAIKLDKIRKNNPEDYFYLKGWIHCLTQKGKNLKDDKSGNSPKQSA